MTNIALVHSINSQIYDEISMHTPKGFTTVSVDVSKPISNSTSLVKDVEFIIVCGNVIPDEIIEAAENVRLIQLLSAGWDFLNIPLVKKLSIPVSNNGTGLSLYSLHLLCSGLAGHF